MITYKSRLTSHFEAKVDGVYGLPSAACPILVFRISARSPQPFVIAVLGIEGGMTLHFPRGQRYLGNLYRLCQQSPPHPMEFHPNNEWQDQLALSLDWDTVHEIERHRDGGGVTFSAGLQFACAGVAKDASEVQSLFWLQVDLARDRSSEIKVSQAEWIEVLDRWNYAEILPLEVVLPKDDVNRKTFSSSWAHLTDAKRLFLAGDYPGTLVACRKAMEAVHEPFKGYIKALDGDKNHSLRRDNTEGLYNALKGFASLGAHPGHAAKRPEALAGLNISEQFLAFLSKQEIPTAATGGSNG